MNNNNKNDPYANQQPARRGRASIKEDSFENTSESDEDESMDASAFVKKHCMFAEASMMTNELAQSQNPNGGQQPQVNPTAIEANHHNNNNNP